MLETLIPGGPNIDPGGKMVKPVANGKTLKQTSPRIDTNSKMVKPPSAINGKIGNGKTGQSQKW